MTLMETMIRGARGAFRAGVTLDGKDVDGRLFPLDAGIGRGLSLVGNQSATYEELYKTQVWIQAVVNRLSRSIARLPLKVYVNPDEPASRERVRTGALADLIRRPAPRLGPNGFVQQIVANVAIHGNAVAVKQRKFPGAPVSALLCSSYAYWRVQLDSEGNTWYVFNPGVLGKASQAYRPEDVVHFRWWAGGIGLWAASPLESLRTTLMQEDATQRATIAAFENGVRPSGAFSTPGAPSKQQLDALRADVQAIYGGVDNTAKIGFFPFDLKWQPMTTTFVDSELINLRKLTREEVAAAYNMPPPVIGILDKATFSNISEQHLMEATDTMQPWTDMISEALSVQLIDEEPSMAGEYVEFEFGALLAGDPNKQIQTLRMAVNGPIMTPDEARERLNLPPLGTEQSTSLAPPSNASVPAPTDSGGGSGN